jgi:hypothetical protein
MGSTPLPDVQHVLEAPTAMAMASSSCLGNLGLPPRRSAPKVASRRLPDMCVWDVVSHFYNL